jgi:hypothetical protein
VSSQLTNAHDRGDEEIEPVEVRSQAGLLDRRKGIV